MERLHLKIFIGITAFFGVVIAGMYVYEPIADRFRIPWGEELGGLRTRLVPVTEEFTIGESMVFKLELKNVSNSPIKYDCQRADRFGSIKIIRPNGREAAYVGGSGQTCGNDKTIMPGEVKLIFDDLDIDKQYNIVDKGVYKISFRRYKDLYFLNNDMESETELKTRYIPESNVLSIKVRTGAARLHGLAFDRIERSLPDRWEALLHRRVEEESNAKIVHMYNMEGPLSEAVISTVEVVQADGTCGPGTGFHSRRKKAWEYLGRNDYGHVYFRMNKNAAKSWPQARDDVIKALGVTKDQQE